MVDQEDADSVVVAHGADDGGELRDLGLGPAAGSSISTNVGRRERACDAEAALVAVGERTGRGLGM